MPHDSPESIKSAYRRLVMMYHPDLNPNQSNTLILQEINEAFEVLSDKEKKKEYDIQLYYYIQNLQKSVKICENPNLRTYKSTQKKFYVRRNLNFRDPANKSNSQFFRPKDLLIPMTIIACFVFIAFYIRFKNQTYKIEPFQKSSIKIDVYSVNLSRKLPSAYLPNDFFDYTQITQLDLSNNQLFYLSKKFGNLKNLKALNLNNNLIQNLHDGFSVMKQMVFLNLSNNPLKEFPEEILTMKNLEILWLDNCQLNDIPVQKMEFHRLRYLFLRGNPIPQEIKNQLRLKFPKCYIVY